MRGNILPVFVLAAAATVAEAFSAGGRGFGKSSPSSNNDSAFASFDRFRASCPADVDAVSRFDPSLIKAGVDSDGGGGVGEEDDVWVAVYRSKNNLPSVFVKDAFLDAMKVATTAQDGDSETLVSSSSPSASGGVLISNNNSDPDGGDAKPVAVARLGYDADSGCRIIDSMRCVLKKENTDPDCDGGSEHTEAVGVCIDELVLSYLTRYLVKESDGDTGDGKDEKMMAFDGGIHFRGTLVSGKLLDSRGFREVTELTSDMHSHESDFDGALAKYAERSTSKEVAKNPGARDRALKIVSRLGRVDREGDRRRAERRKVGVDSGEDGEEEESDFDPWASVKRFI